MAMVNGMLNIANVAANVANVKDSRWLTLEVCREFQRSKCTRTDTECKFAHPPPHVEVQNGRVTACFDSIKGKCQRKEPPCKYLHPPQHLREQLLQNGRNNLILKNLQLQAAQAAVLSQQGLACPGLIPVVNPTQDSYQVSDMSSTLAYSPVPSLPGSCRPEMLESGLSKTAMAYPTMFPTGPVLAHSYMGGAPTQLSAVPNPYSINMQTMGMPSPQTNGETPSILSHPAGCIPAGAVPSSAKMSRPDRLEPQVVEVLTGKKRARDPTDDLVLQQTQIPMMGQYKRIAVADSKGFPMYQPTNTNMLSYQQAIAAMQLQQPQYIPVTFAGHPPSLPRF